MAMEGQPKGKKAQMPMKEPMVPMQELTKARFNSSNSSHSNNTRGNRDYEAGSPKWSPSPSSSLASSAPALPKPAELIARYVAQGLTRDAASEKVIEDLQAALHRSLYPMQKLMSLEKTFRSTATRFDSASERLSIIESKLDSKPNFAQVFAAGVAAGVFIQTAAKATPPVVVALSDILGNVKRAFQR